MLQSFFGGGQAAQKDNGSQSHETSDVTAENKSDGSDHSDTENEDEDIDPSTGQIKDNTPKQQTTQQSVQSQQQQKPSSSPMTPASGSNDNSSKKSNLNTVPLSFTPIEQSQNNNNNISDFRFDVPSEGTVRKMLQYGDGTPFKNIDISNFNINNNNNNNNNNNSNKLNNGNISELEKLPEIKFISQVGFSNNNNNISNNNTNTNNSNFDTKQLLEIPAMDRITEQLKLATQRPFKFTKNLNSKYKFTPHTQLQTIHEKNQCSNKNCNKLNCNCKSDTGNLSKFKNKRKFTELEKINDQLPDSPQSETKTPAPKRLRKAQHSAKITPLK